MRTGTFNIDGDYYHFNEDGTMHTGLLEENDETYFYSDKGIMQTGIVIKEPVM